MSQASRFDRADFDARYRDPGVATGTPADEPWGGARTDKPLWVWPISAAHLLRVGESVLAQRRGKNRPHKGIDLFAAAGVAVQSASAGQVIRVVDGRKSSHPGLRRAGLFVDVAWHTWVLRYLHLGSVAVRAAQPVRAGETIGKVAAAKTSGLGAVTHLHFEVRRGDYARATRDYGEAVDPLRLLPARRA